MAGLYVHIPYCHAKCFYCDFFSTPRAETSSKYINALIEEAKIRAGEINETFETLYIGGGTPSSIGAEALEQLVDGISRHVDLSRVQEFTVEVNPEDVTPALVDRLRSIGVNRVSMGVQSLDDAELKAVGRRHSATEAIKAIETIATRIDNFSLDLIFGLPGQTLDSLNKSLNGLLDFAPPHLSCYLLSYEPGTRLSAMLQAGKIEEASDVLATEMYHQVTSRLKDAGYDHYEISNYCLPGRESRHNSSYWNSTPYLGLGTSAHSFDGVTRRFNPSNIKQYLSTINSGSACYIIDEEEERERFNDYIITRLRTRQGIDLRDLAEHWSPELHQQFSRAMSPLVSTGAIIKTGDQISIPEERWLASDDIMRHLIIV